MTVLLAALLWIAPAAASTTVRWFVDQNISNSAHVLDYVTGAGAGVVDGIIPCCGKLMIDGAGNFRIKEPGAALNDRTALRKAGKSVHVDIGGFSDACPLNQSCPMWERRESLATNITRFALENKLTGFTLGEFVLAVI